MIRLKDWELFTETANTRIRLGVENPVEWQDRVHQEHPILDNLYEQGKFEQYETMFTLLGLSYETYLRDFYTIPIIRKAMPQILANYIVGVQPMSAPAGKQFKK